ncbi:MAG TPA: D-2-hydroxyacid dehydrogenase [Candidatus Limnocylindria bacterium]|nr:D-2-hydroxyacid dehydrogenase [Candidatus Limnocylindria bacterium]
MGSAKILIIPQLPDAVLDRIARVDGRVEVLDARGWFDGELRATWPQWTVDRYLGNRKYPPTTVEQRNQALDSAEVVLLGWPPVKDIRARAPRLEWVHELPAGASNFLDTDLWGSDIIVTTSRGLTNRRPMAEYVLASYLHFSRGLHWSYRDRQRRRFEHQTYDPINIRDKTVCVVGAGGIGQEVAKLCAAAGMRVVGTRRDATSEAPFPAGFARLETAAALHELLRESEFVAICCPWTSETTNLIGREAFAAMKPGTVLVNISRGEIVDEEALMAALEEGKLRGVAMDVYVGEFEGPPDLRLWDDERVMITPHVSAATDVSEHQGVTLFCDNLARYLEGRPLENVIDWQRGY